MATVQDPSCSTCKYLALPHFGVPVDELVASVARGCKWCLVLQKAVEWHRSIGELSSILVVRDGPLLLYVVPKEPEKNGFIVELYSDANTSSGRQNIVAARNISPEKTLEASSALIKRWLQDCVDRHPACGINSVVKLPTRVVDVGSSQDDVRLYVSKGEGASYAALSHCWGTDKKPMRTLKATLKEHQKLIKIGSEFKTFADAVNVTRSLGIRYLWIDSLCIVQDDDDDWTVEAARISDVYHNATVTFSADGAYDVSGGLLTTTNSRQRAHSVQTIEVEWEDGDITTFYARLRALPPSNPESFPHSSLPTEPSKLSTRGWVIQERILSRRMVHFYEEELVWSCHSQQRCECRLLPGAPVAGTFRRLLADSESGVDLLMEWPHLVTQYTSRDLTFEKDRLPAISGLAALMKEHTKSEYLAGLWTHDLDYMLLWMSDHAAAKDKPVERMPIEPYAPSWSWSSVVGPVKYIPRHRDQFSHRRSGGDEIKPVYECVQAATFPLTSNVYGPSKYGFVTIEGQLLPIFYDEARKVWRPEAIESFDFTNPNFEGAPRSAIGEPRIEPQFIFDVLSEYPEDGPPRTRNRGYALLRAAQYLWQGQWSSASTEVVAIFLVQVSVDPLAFRRRGIVLRAFDAVKVWTKVPKHSVILC